MKIAVLDDYLGYSQVDADWGPLAGDVTVFREPIRKEDLPSVLAPFEAVCVMRERTPLPGSLIAALPKLRLIVTTGMRNFSIDMAAAGELGITVCGTASRTAATSHLAMTLILAAARNLIGNVNAVAAGGWQAEAGHDLEDLTLGLVGLGRLGAEVARLAAPFGVNLLAWSENLTEARCEDLGVGRAESLTDLLAASNVVSIHLVLSSRTKGLIDAEALARMKPDACLVNTSRGPIVDRDALLGALRDRTIRCAALDVFDEEPLPEDSPWRDTELIGDGRLILTPHIGYGARATYARMYSETAECVRAFADGAPIRVLVDPVGRP